MNWWDDQPNERYWCEVTDRADIGANLMAPQLNDADKEYWGYSLVLAVQPGDIVFHYSTNDKAFVGASVAGDPVEQAVTRWRPHGTSGRAKSDSEQAPERPGWLRPLHGFTRSGAPLRLDALNTPFHLSWISAWKDTKESQGPWRAKIPFQCRSDGLRGGQGYLFKMPEDFVERWTELATMAEGLASLHEHIGARTETLPYEHLQGSGTGFNPKNESDYEAYIPGGKQRKTRAHEKLVREVGEWLRDRGAVVSTPHPIDLRVTSPKVVLFEAKTTRARRPIRAVREAVGQLFEYRRFVGPSVAELAILLDSPPDPVLQAYVEEDLDMRLFWWDGDGLKGARIESLLQA